MSLNKKALTYYNREYDIDSIESIKKWGHNKIILFLKGNLIDVLSYEWEDKRDAAYEEYSALIEA